MTFGGAVAVAVDDWVGVALGVGVAAIFGARVGVGLTGVNVGCRVAVAVGGEVGVAVAVAVAGASVGVAGAAALPPLQAVMMKITARDNMPPAANGVGASLHVFIQEKYDSIERGECPIAQICILNELMVK